jgi:hypothetical protein
MCRHHRRNAQKSGSACEASVPPVSLLRALVHLIFIAQHATATCYPDCRRDPAEAGRRAPQADPGNAPTITPCENQEGSPGLHGDCLHLIPTLEDGSVKVVVTSPPYAEQRAGHYGGIPEEPTSSPLVFYLGRVDPTRGVPVGAFGIADEPEPLLHLVSVVLERQRI